MEKKDKSKICFVLQQYSVGTHMDYVYELARTLRVEEGLPLTLFIEKGTCPSGAESWSVVQKFSFVPLRVLENIYRMLQFRFLGHTVFYVHYSFVSAISAGLITKLFGGKVYYWNAGMPWLYKRPWFVEWYQKLAYRLIDKLVTGAEALRVGYANFYALHTEKIVVIPNWIDLKNITPMSATQKMQVREYYKIPLEGRVVLYVHKLAERKGANFLPEIMEKLSVDPTVYMVIVGDGPLVSSVQNDMMTRGIEERVRFAGVLDRADVVALYKAADIFIMPSQEEGSPHALIEAMAYGLPFVAFAVGGVSETAPSSWPYLYAYGDVSSCVEACHTLLHDTQAYTEAQLVLATHVCKFEKTKIVAAFQTLLVS